MTNQASHDASMSFLRSMLLIRRAEEQMIGFANEHSGLVRGNYHVSIGQEATGVGVCAALREDDYVFTTHRNHGHVIARGGAPGRVLAEVIGRTGGYNEGRGGTFHVAAPELGIVQTSAIVGGSIPLAAGAAFSIKRRGTDQVSLCFLGDGVMEEGAFNEGINIAALWKLPVVYICENNRVGPGGELRRSTSLAAKELVDVPSALGIPSFVVDGSDVRAVAELAADLVGRTRHGEGPFFVESRVAKWPGSMVGPDPSLVGGAFDIAWAWSPEVADPKLQIWLRQDDPVSRLARFVTDAGTHERDEIEALDAEVRDVAARAARFALESPAPSAESAMDHVFA